MAKQKDAQGLKDFFSAKDWKEIQKSEPMLDLMAAASWQDPANFATLSTSSTEVTDIFPISTKDDSKGTDRNRRDLLKQCWSKYKLFGPLNAAIDSKAQFTTGAGFSVYSDILEVNEFLKDLIYEYRNRLYAKVIGWIVRMQAEGELFLLISLDDFGTATVHSLEPEKIGKSDEGLICDPEDVTQTLFYQHYSSAGEELIPDARFMIDPEYMIERQKFLGKELDQSKIGKLTKSPRHRALGGYRRFVLHWKNLSGIHEYKRDIPPLVVTLEWINLYTQAIKWELDYKKALCAYTISINFTDSPAGKVAWHVWNKMTPEQKRATKLTEPFTPGSRVFMMPGMEIKVHAPQLPPLAGSNQDLLNLSGSGARMPEDLWRGKSSGSTQASVKATRPPFIAQIENMQYLFGLFFKYEFLRACMNAKILMGGKIETRAGGKFKLAESYKDRWIEFLPGGTVKEKKYAIEPCDTVKMTFPTIELDIDPQSHMNSMLGSKHAGAYSIGMSAETIARKIGVDDISRERRMQYLEKDLYGIPVTGTDSESSFEQGYKDQGVDGAGNQEETPAGEQQPAGGDKNPEGAQPKKQKQPKEPQEE